MVTSNVCQFGDLRASFSGAVKPTFYVVLEALNLKNGQFESQISRKKQLIWKSNFLIVILKMIWFLNRAC